VIMPVARMLSFIHNLVMSNLQGEGGGEGGGEGSEQ